MARNSMDEYYSRLPIMIEPLATLFSDGMCKYSKDAMTLVLHGVRDFYPLKPYPVISRHLARHRQVLLHGGQIGCWEPDMSRSCGGFSYLFHTSGLQYQVDYVIDYRVPRRVVSKTNISLVIASGDSCWRSSSCSVSCSSAKRKQWKNTCSMSSCTTQFLV